MRKIILVVVVGLMGGAVFADEMPPVANGAGVTLRDLVGTPKLVTVVLKESGAMDHNLRVADIGPNSFAVLSPNNERTAYLFSSVAEIRLQDGKVETKKFTVDETRSLKVEEQKVVERAFDRAREIFEASNADQGIKMRAAVLLALSGKKEARDHLWRLATSNELETRLDAALCLYLVGEKEVAPTLVAQGLQSGNRKTRAKAARLAGLVGDKASIPLLAGMVQDRAGDLAGPAARALARLEYREMLPVLTRMILERDEEKGRAAVFALSRLGGPDVIQRVKKELEGTPEMSQVRYRLVVVLYKLGDPLGKQLLAGEMMEVKTLAEGAALFLAREGDFRAMQYLSERLKRRYDQTEEAPLVLRANAAAALIEGGDPTAISHLQELLRSDKPAVKKAVCMVIAETGKRKLIPITQSAIENANPDVALHACSAAIGIARPEFRERLLEARE
jgi:HEAT repeat protein